MIKASLLATSSIIAVSAQPLTVGFLSNDHYTMQNTYLIQMLNRMSDSGLVARNASTPKTLQIKTRTFNNSVDLQNCLNTQVCSAALDY